MNKKTKFFGAILVLLLVFNCSSSDKEEFVEEEVVEEVEEIPEEEVPEETNTTPPVCEGIKQTAPALVDKSVEPVANEADKCDVFLEENGLLIMEAENTKSDYGKWVFSDVELTVKDKDAPDIHTTVTLKDHRGTGYLRFTGKWGNDEEKSPLSYMFKIKNAGTYRLFIRNLKGLHEESDKNNDCFVRMEGDFDLAEVDDCVNTKNLGFLPESKKDVLKEDTKFFGASNEKWNPSGKLDAHGVGFKPWAVYNFKAGETYTLVVSGRSSKYYIDRILLVDVNKYTFGEFSNYVNNAVQNACE